MSGREAFAQLPGPGLGAAVVFMSAGLRAAQEELAGAAVFLASRASDFVTGQSIVVDGGYSIAWSAA